MLITFDIAVMIASLELFRVASHTFKAEEEFMVLGLVALLILLSTSLASELRIPAAAVEIFAGILAAMYGVHTNDPLKVINGIGAYLLLFMVGLRVEVDLIRGSLGRTLTLGRPSMDSPCDSSDLHARSLEERKYCTYSSRYPSHHQCSTYFLDP